MRYIINFLFLLATVPLTTTAQIVGNQFIIPVGGGSETASIDAVRAKADSAKVALPIVQINLSAYGVRVGSIDNGPALMAMRTKLLTDAGGKQPWYHFYLPGGKGDTIQWSNNRWLYGIKRFTVHGNGVYVRTQYTGSDEMLARPFSSGELFQTAVLAYNGAKSRPASYRFNTVEAGVSSLTLTTTAEISNFSGAVGKLVLIRGFEQIGFGYPPGDRYFEYHTIQSVNTTTGVVTLSKPTEYRYDSQWYDLPNYPGPGESNGKPRITLLDGTNNFYCEYAEFRDLEFGPATGGYEANLVFSARELHFVGVKNRNGWTWASENELVTYDGCELDRAEFDKLVKNVVARNTTWRGIVTGGFGCDKIALYNCTAGEQTVLSPKELILDECSFRKATQPGTGETALGLSPGRNFTRRVTIRKLKFTSGSTNTAEEYADLDPFSQLTVPAISGRNIILPYGTASDANALNAYRLESEGQLRIFKSDGTKSGYVTRVTFDATYNSNQGAFVIEGTWAAPVVGEVWRWSPVGQFVDLGGHTATGSSRLFTPGSARVQGNPQTGDDGEQVYVITEKSLKYTGNRELEIPLNGKIRRIEVYVKKAATQNQVIELGRTSPFATIAKINLQQTGYRTLDEFASAGAKTGDALSVADVAINTINLYLKTATSSNGALTSILPADTGEFFVKVHWIPN